ncbi:hypothetical protein BHECKSOX_1660 [Bathymodiolus heckerae thiotrophic gill symbiont]|uniref:type IV secretion system protein n=1 Tax=Bathymodiolus heckerae thiotrophic gill symbiont TaxID=1052212 RepID=UPI0010B54AD9|nr:type IV secretion system protein [Bathymodiolus heckerae thiotrophic gill symbiont]SHN91356.1 hypothetical protein BHECKSOX_1660 [Bathymodiolus heckerae thiotrophic gill symbiont]
MASTLFQDMFTTVDTALINHVANGSSNLIALLTPIFNSMFIIWITIWGYMAMMGRIEGLLQDSFFRMLRITFIIMLGLTSAQYNAVIVTFLQQAPETIASAIIGAPTAGITATLDDATTKIFNSGINAWNRGGLSNLSQLIIALLIFGFGGVLIILLASLILMSKVSMTLLLAIGPLFIISTLFQSTQRFFDSWIGIIMNSAFILIIAASLGSTFLTIANNFATGRVNPTMSDAFAFFLLFSMMIFFVKQIPGIAAALGGGFALSAQGAMRGMVDKIKGAANTVDRLPRHFRNTKNALNQGNRLTTKAANLGVNATKHAYQRTFRKNTISN